jgi:hypothetical protein
VATYSQWRAKLTAGRPPRLTWVCGLERVLSDEVVAVTRRLVAGTLEPGEDLDYEVYTAGQAPERDIWAAALSIPYGVSRFVVVREASRLARWEMLEEWLHARRELAQCWLVLDDTPAADFPRVTGEDGKQVLAPHAAWIRDSSLGQLVRCSPLSDEDLAAWVQRETRAQVSADDAGYLMARASGDMTAVRDVCRKAAVLAGTPSRDALAVLCDEHPAAEFAEALLRGERRQAALAATAMSREDTGWAIGLLVSRLDTLEAIRRARDAGAMPHDTARHSGVKSFLVREYAPLSAQYGDARLRQLRSVLAVADDAWRSGAREGVAELIAACWA